MHPEPSYLDVGTLYLFLAFVVFGVIVLVRHMLRATNIGEALRCLGAFAKGAGVLILFSLVAGGLYLGVACGIGWVVHALNWWPY